MPTSSPPDLQRPGTGRTAIGQSQGIAVDYTLTPEDFDRMHLIARVSSRSPESVRWTELALYFETDFGDRIRKRPFVAVVEGHSILPNERLKRQFAAMGSLRRALDWFEDSDLADKLQRTVELEIGDPELTASEVLDALLRRGVLTVGEAGEPKVADARLVEFQNKRIGFEKRMTATKPQPRPELPSFTAALAWLYPGDDLSERARALAFERDFGMPERTVRNTLAIEAGRVEGKVGPWVQPMLVALRWFDRAGWEASRG